MSRNYARKTLIQKDVDSLLALPESWLIDKKGKDIKPSKLSRTISAFANLNGGEVYLGIAHGENKNEYYWDGFDNEEKMNPFIAVIEEMFASFEDYSFEIYQNENDDSLVLHIIVNKTQKIIYASDAKAYYRQGVQNLPCDTDEKLRRLSLDKGLSSFEDEYTQSNLDELKNSSVLLSFLEKVAPTTTPYDWLRRQKVMNSNAQISVAGVLLYDEVPQSILPKQSAIKILRYHTEEAEGTRETLDQGYPITIEGDLYSLIHKAVKKTKEIVEQPGVVGKLETEIKEYPEVTLHEIITNAVLHRDYSIKKDILIRIFTNRIEIESPGILPGHITLKNIMQEQCARNAKIVRLIAKFPDPPNKDVGEGLNTAFKAMIQMQLKEPVIKTTDCSVIVIIKHERLADAETVVMEYLREHICINNETARSLTGITDANKMKRVFYRLRDQGQLEIVPGTQAAATFWRKKIGIATTQQNNAKQLSVFDSEME